MNRYRLADGRVVTAEYAQRMGLVPIFRGALARPGCTTPEALAVAAVSVYAKDGTKEQYVHASDCDALVRAHERAASPSEAFAGFVFHH